MTRNICGITSAVPFGTYGSCSSPNGVETPGYYQVLPTGEDSDSYDFSRMQKMSKLRGRVKLCVTNNTRPDRWSGYALMFALAFALSNAAQICAESLLLRGATVHTVSGETIAPGDVLIRNGKIAAVGKTIKTNDATVVSLTGQHLYPGLIAATSSLGLTEINAVRASQDTSEVGEYTPDVQAWIAVNPDSELIPVARANGIAHALTVPLGASVSGQSGLIALDGWTTEQMTIKHPAALHLFWPSMVLEQTARGQSRGSSNTKSLDDQAKDRVRKLKEIDDFFTEAESYAKAQRASKKENRQSSISIPAWEAMLPFLQGQIPLVIHANEVRQIKAAVNWAVGRNYRIILAGGRDAWMVASLLAEHKVPVIYEAMFDLPARDIEPYDVHFKTPGLLQKAGVTVIFSQGAGATPATQVRNLPYAAAQAAAFGLPADEALKGITLYPARILQVADRLGSIETGKDATLFAADGDILDIRSRVTRIWIGGREVSLQSRHTRLFEKYKGRPSSKPSAPAIGGQ
ncbi:MAG: amidohydrolase family protein [Verrucomicrobia bacterium]|nr:amidohydrolase family protein [Verrucomicrobiota bacterium]